MMVATSAATLFVEYADLKDINKLALFAVSGIIIDGKKRLEAPIMLNLIDIIRCFIHHRGYSNRGVSFIDNQTGFLECLIAENRLVNALPLIDAALNNLSNDKVGGALVISRNRSSLRISFKGEVISRFDNEIIYRAPFPAKTELSQIKTGLSTIDDIQRYSDIRMGNSRWKWRWSYEAQGIESTILVYPISNISQALKDNPSAKKAYFPFLNCEIELILQSIRRKQLSILVADDSPASLGATAAMLKSLGVDVFTARDGKEALSLAMSQHFDVLLLDEKMPELYGSDVINKVQKCGPNVAAAKVILSGIASSKDIARVVKKGADKMISKPVSKLVLKQLVQEFLDERSLVKLTPL